MYNAMKSYGVTQLENHTCGFRGFGFILVSRHGLGDWYFEECLLLIIHLFYSSCVIPVGGGLFFITLGLPPLKIVSIRTQF